MKQVRRWHIYESPEELQAFTVRAIVRAAAQAIETHGRFTVVLAGGNTPKAVYAGLVDTPAKWENWYVYFGDERCRPVGDAERNDRMAQEAWLNHVPIPKNHIRSIPAEHGAEEGAKRYSDILTPIDRFDFVLLGIGEDGHTASLFPGMQRNSVEPAIPVYNSPKPPPERVSLSAARLSRAKQVMFVVAGEGKRKAVAAWRRGEAIPAATIVPSAGVDILLDVSAWPDRFA